MGQPELCAPRDATAKCGSRFNRLCRGIIHVCHNLFFVHQSTVQAHNHFYIVQISIFDIKNTWRHLSIFRLTWPLGTPCDHGCQSGDVSHSQEVWWGWCPRFTLHSCLFSDKYSRYLKTVSLKILPKSVDFQFWYRLASLLTDLSPTEKCGDASAICMSSMPFHIRDIFDHAWFSTKTRSNR